MMARLNVKVGITLVFLIILLIINVKNVNSQVVSDAGFDLVLAGGGLATCSSMSVKNCTKKISNKDGLVEVLYQFSDENVQAIKKSDFLSSLAETQKLNVNSIFTNLNFAFGEQAISKSSIRTQLKSSGLYPVYSALSDKAYYGLLDYFEFKQLDAGGNRKQEVVYLSNNKNEFSKFIYEAFYQQALIKANNKGKTKPHLIVVTASSRDPFESADFYTSVMGSFDAKVTWLPLDMNLNIALSTGKASCLKLDKIRNENLLFNRGSIYPKRTSLQKQYCLNPQRLYKSLQSADGLFLNGGDQSRTRAAFISPDNTDSKHLSLIKHLVAKKQLVVAGTSAGTAVLAGGQHSVQPIAMLTNGSPKVALKRGAFSDSAPSARCSETTGCQSSKLNGDDLTYNPQGGLGLFNLGLLDTHFSERNREVRLNVFAHASNSRFAFGIDEATALMVQLVEDGKVNAEVIGENGVYITDVASYPSRLVKNGSKNYVAGVSHFINSGDRMTWDNKSANLHIGFKPESRLLNKLQTLKPLGTKSTWRNNLSKNCGNDQQFGWELYDDMYSVKASVDTQFAVNNKQQCSYTNLPFVISQ